MKWAGIESLALKAAPTRVTMVKWRAASTFECGLLLGQGCSNRRHDWRHARFDDRDLPLRSSRWPFPQFSQLWLRADCYGIVLRCGAADNLIENNIVRYMNKPILFNVSGGGNVIGYNYADNSWATPAAWQEVNIDTHCSFPHMELMEGNYAPHMGATITHGNAGYLTFFRNYSSSQFAPPAVDGSTDKQTGNIVAIQFDTGDINMTVIGNVLGARPPLTSVRHR